MPYVVYRTDDVVVIMQNALTPAIKIGLSCLLNNRNTKEI